MNPKLTLKNLRFFYLKVFTGIIVLAMIGKTSFSQVLFNESFNTVAPLPTGWAALNNSSPLGTTGWFQGNATVFASNSGATTAYIAANYQNVNDGTISNWLFAPNVTMKNGDIFTFYTRTTTFTGTVYPDRLQVRMSTNGASTNAGATATSVGDFTTLLLDINPTYADAYPHVWTQYTVTISGLGGPTSGRLAFRYFVEDGGLNGTNSDYMGIDDAVYTSFSGACTGAPAPGNTVSSVPTICPTNNFTLSLQNPPGTSGNTYQWQKSPDGTTWTDIAGATNSTLTTNQIAATWYRCNVTCAFGTTTASNPLLEPMSPPSECYCTPGATNCTFDDEILNVKFGGINQTSSGCSGSGYTNYTSSVGDTGIAYSGVSNPMSVQVGPGGTEYVTVWIDYNHNGTFDATEYTLLGSGNGSTISGNIAVPATALTGYTRMRVRVRFAGAATATQACTAYTFGETEDYTVNIVPCVQGVINTQPANTTIHCGDNTTITSSATGSLLTYLWEYRVSASSPWLNVPNAAPYSGVTTNTLTITAAPGTLNGYQYRVIVAGACTAIITSSVATLTVDPFVPNVLPSSAVTLCNGGIQQFSTAPPQTVVNVCSGPLAINIPDNTATGASTTLTVSGIPAGATIVSMSATINLTHTYCGDMLINLKAPNGNILALDKYLTATANQAGVYPNIGFVNTIISSAGVNALSTAASQPITGTFKADAINGTITGPTVQNPAGFVSNAANFAALYSSPNGVYTLAMADGGPADLGTLTSWCLTIVYQFGPSATATWSPVTGLFTDPAATIPYTGTVVSTVYAAPTVTTNYNLVVNTPICTANTNVLVTVNNPVSAVSTVPNAATCDNGDASFSVTASGGTIEYQWQESTDAGATWTDITDGGVYDGATTGTLTLTGVTLAPVNFNNNQYRAILTVPTCNADTSNAATLTVHPNPVVVIAAGPYTQLYPGITTTLTAAVSPSADPTTYQWYKNGVAVPGATANTVNVDVDNLGEYTVSVVNGNGCNGASTASITISAAPNDIMFIYPSPNTGTFQVRYQSLDNNILLPRNVSVFDSKGSRIYTKTYIINAPYGKMEVIMPNHAKGIYRVELSDRNGNRIKTGSVLIL